jgi:hypothetical protein
MFSIVSPDKYFMQQSSVLAITRSRFLATSRSGDKANMEHPGH